MSLRGVPRLALSAVVSGGAPCGTCQRGTGRGGWLHATRIPFEGGAGITCGNRHKQVGRGDWASETPLARRAREGRVKQCRRSPLAL